MISMPNAFYGEKHSTRVCMFVKDPQRAFKDEIEDLEIPCIAKVIGVDKLKRNYRQFKDKR